MSSQKGNASRSRPQKYQNQTVFKNDLYDKSHKTKFINNIEVANVCERCKKIIEWKIKYKKYKPLKAPAKCTKCEQKCVKHAYHIMCLPCSKKYMVCPKCGEKSEIVEGKPSREESIKLDAELQSLIRSLPERKRRTFLRYMNRNAANNKGKSKDANDNKNDNNEELDKEEEEEGSKGFEAMENLTRDDLLSKLKSLAITEGRDDDFGSDTSDDLDSFM